MSQHGSGVVLTNNPRGNFLEGIISGTPKPGVVMQLQAGTAPVNGRNTWEVYNPSSTGDPRLIAVLLPEHLQGKTIEDAYVSGTRGFLYCPLPGDELNMRFADNPGTGTSVILSVGTRLKVTKGTGELAQQSSSSSDGPFILMEDDLKQDDLNWVMFTGARG